MSVCRRFSEADYVALRGRQADLRKQKTADYQHKVAKQKVQNERDIRPFNRMRWYLHSSERRLRLEREVTAFYGCRTSWPLVLEAAKYYHVVEGETLRQTQRELAMQEIKEGQIVKMRQLDERWRKDVLQGIVQRVELEDVIVQWIDGVTNRMARHRLLPIDIAGPVFVRTSDCDCNREN
jgi:hypothetical protein